MGVGGTLDFLSELLSGGSRRRSYKKKRKQFQTVELKVRMDCEGCELKVRNALSSMKGMNISFRHQEFYDDAKKCWRIVLHILLLLM